MFYDSEGRSYVETSHFQRFCRVFEGLLQVEVPWEKLGKDRIMTWLCVLPRRAGSFVKTAPRLSVSLPGLLQDEENSVFRQLNVLPWL